MSFSIVQKSAAFSTAFAATVAKAFASNNAAGNLLIAFCIGKPTTSLTISDTQMNPWVGPIAGQDNGGQGSALFYCLTSKAGANTVTINNGGSFVALALIEYSSTLGALFDVSAGSNAVSSAVPAAVNISPSTANELVVTMYSAGAGGTTLTPATGNTIEIGAGGFSQAIDATPALAGLFVAGAASGQAGNWSVVAAAFEAATFSISGSAGVAGATVAWSGTSSGSTTADGSGNYTISGLANGSYTITPSLIGYTFSPTSSNQTVSGGNITGVNFVATQQTVVTPTFSPVAGSYTGTQSVAISTTTPSSSIFYTTDGSTPTTGSTPYSGPVTVSVSLTLKAIATSSGFINSAVGSAAYIINTAAYYSVPDCRQTPFGPNSGITNQGTILYTGQTSSNPAVPGTDSRVSKPVDSRASVPTNSRTPGTFGPGE